AAGVKQQWQIQPKYSWIDNTLPVGSGEGQNGWDGDGISQLGGVTFDARTNRLYVLVNGAVPASPRMYVYQVGPVTPQVASLTPSAGATAVSTTTAVTITFDRAMDPTTITTGTIFLKDPTGN